MSTALVCDFSWLTSGIVRGNLCAKLFIVQHCDTVSPPAGRHLLVGIGRCRQEESAATTISVVTGGNGAILAHPLLRLAANCPAPTAVLVREHLTQPAAPDPALTAGEALVYSTVLR